MICPYRPTHHSSGLPSAAAEFKRLAMIDHIREHWWAYWGIGGSIAYMWFQYKQTDTTKSRSIRFRSLIKGYEYFDPQSPSYDPSLPGRQLILLSIGVVSIALALFFVWLLGF